MKLELKHLAPYLPYKLKGTSNRDYNIQSVDMIGLDDRRISINKRNVIADLLYTYDEFKTILRPLSDLTKKIQIAEFYASFTAHIRRITGFEIDTDLDVDTEGCYYIDFYDYQLILEFLYGYHFDVFGLIEKGLAIDINTLDNAKK